ncbi:MAG: NAD(P)H-binding protein, partial [Chloroflexi bacterium]|nr:NAD(P)H-binding protein [Chloroflexota bacterium]
MTSTAVLVTGATGNVGHEVVLELASARVRVRAASTDPARARALLGSDIEILPFAFGRPETYRAAFEGMDGLFLMRPPDVTDVRRLINPALQVAIETGVHQVVFLSLQGVERNPVVPHRSIERALLDSGLTYTFLRASFFMQNLSTTH